MPPAPPSVSPDSPVDPPLPPQSMSSCGLNHLNQFFRMSWCHRHLILTNPEAENDDEELELPNRCTSCAEQLIHKPGENPDDEDSPGSSPKNEPAASSNFSPNNPVNLPMQSDSEEELLPHVPTSSGAGSSQKTMQYTDREEDESENSQRTRQYDDQEADLVLDEAHRSLMTSDQKICANTESFTVPRDIEGNLSFLDA